LSKTSSPLRLKTYGGFYSLKFQVLHRKGADTVDTKITMKLAKEFAESEFEKYRIVQDQLFESDFDRLIQQSGDLIKIQKKKNN
jgi:hypothetical protein